MPIAPNSKSNSTKDEESKKRQDEGEVEDTHREQKRSDSERRRQQNLTQGFNTGTEDVQRITDWGSTRTKKRKK
jgi:hypothetical protein